uniref:Small GTP-binding protein n=1 Tax=Coptotermes formosanus TaxID=36987 RepID=R4UMB4_COPFO|nr:small GTP-binding protein [Coptotermes formosanus]
MGQEISSKNKETNKFPRVLVLGLDNSGKSRLVSKIVDEPYHFVSIPTATVDVQDSQINSQDVTIFDAGGYVTYRRFWPKLIEVASLIIFVIDPSDVPRLPKVKLEGAKVFKEAESKKLPVLIVLSKVDVGWNMKKEKIENGLELKKYRLKYSIVETSASTNIGINDVRYFITTNLNE